MCCTLGCKSQPDRPVVQIFWPWLAPPKSFWSILGLPNIYADWGLWGLLFLPQNKFSLIIRVDVQYQVQKGFQFLYVRAGKKKGGLLEGMPLVLSSLLLSFIHCPLAPCVTWWGFAKCLSWHQTMQADGHECTHPRDNSSLTLRGKRSSWECPNYYWFRVYKYIIQRMLQPLFQFWSRIRATEGQVFVLFESAVMWRKWNWTLEGNAPSFAFCGKSCIVA